MYMTQQPQRKCSRVITYSKYESNSPEMRSWWCKLFKILEEDASIPPDRRFEIVEKIFPNKLLNKIIDVLNFMECDTNVSDNQFQKEIKPHYHSIDKERKHFMIIQRILTSERQTDPEKFKIFDEFYDLVEEKFETKTIQEKHETEPAEKKKEKNIGRNNPYLNFFNRPRERAAIWYTLPPLTLDEMNLNQKADSITETIAKQFVEWIQNLGGKPTSLDVPSVVKMFEVHFNAQAAKSLCIKQKEMSSIPEMLANTLNLPHMTMCNRLQAEIKKDIKFSKKNKKLLAFGKSLPTELQVHPPKREIAEKWISCKNIPEGLKSMSKVWEGITHLSSTQAYCSWLAAHPEITPPQYLVDVNLIHEKYLENGNRDNGVNVVSESKRKNKTMK